MRKLYFLTVSLAALLVTNVWGSTPQAFTKGSLIVERVGDGRLWDGKNPVNQAIGVAINLDEYDVSGETPILLQSILLPIEDDEILGNKSIVAGGYNTLGNLLSLSMDGEHLIIPGFNSVPNGDMYAKQASAINRLIAVLKYDGTLSVKTALTDVFNADGIRSVASPNGVDLFATGGGANGSGGLFYTTEGTTSPNGTRITTIASPRVIKFFKGQMYMGNYNNIAQVGTGIPTSAADNQTVTPITPTLPGADAHDFAFLDTDPDNSEAKKWVIYLTNGKNYDLFKYSLVDGAWVSNGSIKQFASFQTRSVAPRLREDGKIEMFIAAGSGVNGKVYKLVDTGGYNETIGGTASIYIDNSTIANTVIRSLCWGPSKAASSQITTPVGKSLVVQVYAQDQSILIESSTAGVAVEVYTLLGVPVASTTTVEGITSLRPSANESLYLVKVGNVVSKVVIK